jgi:two-component system, sensor histidine kinase and response regulator
VAPQPVASLDPDALRRLRRAMGTEEEYRGMLEEFVSASHRVFADLEHAVAARRAADAERAAHTLKSMARMVGATPLAEACAEAEARGATSAAVAAIRGRLGGAQEAVRACLS